MVPRRLVVLVSALHMETRPSTQHNDGHALSLRTVPSIAIVDANIVRREQQYCSSCQIRIPGLMIEAWLFLERRCNGWKDMQA